MFETTPLGIEDRGPQTAAVCRDPAPVVGARPGDDSGTCRHRFVTPRITDGADRRRTSHVVTGVPNRSCTRVGTWQRP
ncbi:hypothetical protein ACOZ4L_11180 [Haloplanus ruber]|uniref:Uncharacterized protein n=1 Tax=Haloplanus ruber TaxID=869892 RepID=A0ABD6CSM5_9EURY|nr:hypothetical protein [Haloplanus ruber]